MEIRLLLDDYVKAEQFFLDFKSNRINSLTNIFSERYVEIYAIAPFPFYLKENNETERTQLYLEAFRIYKEHYYALNRDITMNHVFWITLFSVHCREYLLRNYPQIVKNQNNFYNILLKSFNWENYIYKIALITQFVCSSVSEEEQEEYVTLISNNMDVFNYLLKYPLFRQENFIIDVLRIIKEENLTNVLKKRLPNTPDKEDYRFGRLVLFEFNKDYPVQIPHVMPYHKFKSIFLTYLDKYINKN